MLVASPASSVGVVQVHAGGELAVPLDPAGNSGGYSRIVFSGPNPPPHPSTPWKIDGATFNVWARMSDPVVTVETERALHGWLRGRAVVEQAETYQATVDLLLEVMAALLEANEELVRLADLQMSNAISLRRDLQSLQGILRSFESRRSAPPAWIATGILWVLGLAAPYVLPSQTVVLEEAHLSVISEAVATCEAVMEGFPR